MKDQFDNRLRTLVRLMLAEDARDLVGDYLWPDDRWTQRKNRGAPKIEPDTPREADLRKRVIRFIMNHRERSIDPAAAEDLLTIASDSRYADTLPLYQKGPVFRGVAVSAGWFNRNFGISYDEILANKPWGGGDKLRDIVQTFERASTLNPANPVTSWSKDWTQAENFAMGLGASGAEFSVPLVYEANSSDGNFIDFERVYDIYSDNWAGEELWNRRIEQEVVSVGPVKISKVHVLGWKHRTPERPLPELIKEPGTGYDDIGTPDRSLPRGLLRVKRKDADRDFDRLNVPDFINSSDIE